MSSNVNAITSVARCETWGTWGLWAAASVEIREETGSLRVA
jgi:hypothetical protein